MCGDYNMMEIPSDRLGGSHISIHGQELAIWERLIFKLRIQDAWHLSSYSKLCGSLHFSKSNRSVDTDGTTPLMVNLSRLDRMYLGDVSCQKIGRNSILVGTTFSNHFPVLLRVQKEDTNKRNHRVKIPDKMYQDQKYKCAVERIWQQTIKREKRSLKNFFLLYRRWLNGFRMTPKRRIMSTPLWSVT
jgi:hypothetical protein